MKKVEIFEPAMCCETGLCGAGVDMELLRIGTVVKNLREMGFSVERFNLTSAPMAFVDNKLVNEFLNKYGADNLPLTLLDGKIRTIGHYPSNKELAAWLELPEDALEATEQEAAGGCCGDDCCEEGSCEDGCCESGCGNEGGCC